MSQTIKKAMPVLLASGSIQSSGLQKLLTALVCAASLRASVMNAASFVPSDEMMTAVFKNFSLAISSASGAAFFSSLDILSLNAARMPFW